MGKQQKTWSAEVKEQIVLSVLRGEVGTAEAAGQHGVNESLVYSWQANFLDALKAARNRRAKVRFLVASDALPRARAVGAADAVTRLEQAEREALTAWTSRLSALQSELRAVRLSVRQAEAKRQGAVAKRWVRSPLAGQVVDVRVVDVSVEGVTLEVVLERGKHPTRNYPVCYL